MSFLNPTENELYNIQTAAPGTTQLQADHWYDGLPKGILQGPVGGIGAIGQAALDLVNSLPTSETVNPNAHPSLNPFTMTGRATATSFNNYRNAPPQARSELSKTIQNTLDEIHTWSQTDPRVQGSGAQYAAGITRGLTLGTIGFAAGGPIGAGALMGGVEANSAYRDAKAQGLDDDTARQMATLAGVTNAAGAAIPMAAGGLGLAGLAKSIAAGAGVNVTIGAANRFATSEILQSHGYQDMARQYEATDASAMAADAILGAAFGGIGHLGKARDPELIHQATEALKGEHIDRSGPGLPVTPDAAQAHNEALAQGVLALDRGQVLKLDDATANAVALGTVDDPAQLQLQRQAVKLITEDSPELAELAKPLDVPEPKWQQPELPGLETETPKAPVPSAESTGPAMSTQASEALQQLVKSHPDLEIPLDDGRVVRVADLPELFANQTAEANKLAKLHDVAAACFLGTE